MTMPAEKTKSTLFCFTLVFLVDFFCILHGFDSFYQLSGDSLCQIGYWKILSRPWLAGSIAGASAKPGQILIFGILHQYSNGVALRVILALFGAGLALSLGMIAADIGGTAAGICSIFFSVGAFSEFVRIGDSTLFLLPFLFGGLSLYYYRSSPMKKWGLLLLVLTPLFRIEAVFAVGIVLLLHFLKKEWKEFAIGSLALAISMGVWVTFLFKIQGEVARFGAGAVCGYTFGPKGPLFASLARELVGVFFHYSPFFSLILILAGVAGACLHFRKHRQYLIVLSPIFIVLINYIILGGSLSTRYFETAFAFGISVGVGVLFALFKRPLPFLLRKGAIVSAPALLLLASTLFYLPLIKRLIAPPPPPPVFISDGLGLYREKLIPAGSRILSEDDALYVLLMNDPDRFKKVYTLQAFNVENERHRTAILANTDFIYLLKGDHPYYYLLINATVNRPDLAPDRFRGIIEGMIRGNSRASIYGAALTPLVNDETRLILKVEHPAN